ncbi:hypothetical protein HOP50_14g71180 [Chloropicon primus]|uniref:Uncharacterized protein n=1 Tax=Chloropicon primus TaxID=1764295 RepID=A0A5B8MYG1_9CHLO|nr:hypothetical protein A3770_14p70980 [Chloropicon primus]UPR03788.1 hypothetical protein HOP50_14g71180 [Chloropicon primus]|eukprot:QDZ24580.1 hypothetical protein A3770_14p70980 [Chloropicon primus]
MTRAGGMGEQGSASTTHSHSHSHSYSYSSDNTQDRDTAIPLSILHRFHKNRTNQKNKHKGVHGARPERYLKRYLRPRSREEEAVVMGNVSKVEEARDNAAMARTAKMNMRLRAPRASIGTLEGLGPLVSEAGGPSPHDNGEYLRLHYEDDEKDREASDKERIVNKIETVMRAGFARPKSVSRKAIHSTVEYKPELLADRARLLKTLNKKEISLGLREKGIYHSMDRVSHMVNVSKKLTEDIGTMDHAMRMRLNAMHSGGDHRSIERCFEPTRGSKRKLKGKTDQTPSAPASGRGSRAVSRGGRRDQGVLGGRRGHPVFGQASRKATETKGSGFRKERSACPTPRWIDHTRLLQRAQLIADLEWNAYVRQTM